MPIASILIPVHNREDLVARTLDSALAQTVRDIEVVVVDNCSTDGTWAVLQKYAAQDARVRIARNESNVGPVRNWRRCVELARAPYAKLLFSDDLIAPSFLERTLPAILSPECGLVFTSAHIGQQPWQGSVSYRSFLDDTRMTREIFVRTALRVNGFAPNSPGAAIFRTADLAANILTELPGVAGYDFAATGAGVDWLIYLLTALRYPTVGYVSEPLANFHAHSGSISIINLDGQVTTGYALAKQWFMANVPGA